MTQILFIRHGETDWNVEKRIQGQTDIPLNEKGIKQAGDCARALKNSHYDLIISSPLLRALSTAKIINKQTKLPLLVNDAFKERSFGEAEGMSLTELNRLYPKRNYPKMETRLRLNKRIIEAINYILVTYPNKNIIIVAHGAVLNSLLSTVTNHLHGSTITRLKNGSFTHISFRSSNWKLNYLNQTRHLKAYD